MNRLLSEVCRSMADELGARATRVQTELQSNLPLLALDRVQVQQVLVN